MKKKQGKIKEKSPIISEPGITPDVLSSRGGLTLFSRYIRQIGLCPRLEMLFGAMKKSRKGQRVIDIFKQILCNFVDGTSRHLVQFDRMKEDAGYAGAIESVPSNMVSSHAVKRFFQCVFVVPDMVVSSCVAGIVHLASWADEAGDGRVIPRYDGDGQ